MALTRFLAPLMPLALLAACGSEPEGEEEQAASGEVLEGTISDEMLPLDQLRSKPPLLEPELAPAEVPRASGTAPVSDAEPEAVAEQEPAQEPATEPAEETE